jgi:hypothetical protein
MFFSFNMKTDQIFGCIGTKVFLGEQKLAWICLEDYNYPRTALWLPEYYRKEAICEAHDQIFAGHNAAQKSYIFPTSSNFLPNVSSQVLEHTYTCLRCQQHKSSKLKPPPKLIFAVNARSLP